MQILLKCVNYKQQKEAILELGGFKMRVYKPMMPGNDRLSFQKVELDKYTLCEVDVKSKKAGPSVQL